MIKILVNTTNHRDVERSVPFNSTPKAVMDGLGLKVNPRTQINLDGMELSSAALGKTFEELEFKDGATLDLNIVVKAEGGL